MPSRSTPRRMAPGPRPPERVPHSSTAVAPAWLVAGGTVVAFGAAGAIDWPMNQFWPVIMALQLITIGLPAHRNGRLGAWGGAALGVLTLAVAYGARLASFHLSDIWLQLKPHLIASAVLGLMFGEMGQIVRGHRHLAADLRTFTERALTLEDPQRILEAMTDTATRVTRAAWAACWVRDSISTELERRVVVGAPAGLAAVAEETLLRGRHPARHRHHLVPFAPDGQDGLTGYLVLANARRPVHDRLAGIPRALEEIASISEVALRQAALAAAARTSERQFRDLFHGLPNGFVVADPAGRIRLANHTAGNLMGVGANRLAGEYLSSYVDAADWPRLRDRLRTPQADPPLRVTLLPPGGGQRRTEWVFGTASGTDAQETLGFFRDAGDAVARERETNTLVAAMHCLEEGVIIADTQATIRFANPAAARMHGYETGSAMVGRSFQALTTEDPDDFAGRFGHALVTGWSEETVHRRADGTEVPVQATTSPVLVDRTVVGVVAALRDLTREKAVAQRAAAADKLATLGRLVAGAAHEINNPLAAILANAELLKGGGTIGADALESVDVILRESQRAGRIVRDLLAFARQRPVSRQPVRLGAVVEHVTELRRGYARASGIDIQVEIEGAPRVLADADQLSQVLLNLLVNAEDVVQTRPDPRVRVTVRQEGDAAVIHVDDSGPGVPRALVEKIFDPFFTTKPEGRGTGLGLAVSFGIIAEHGGRLHVEASPLGGARFVIVLPLTHAQRDRPAEVTPACAPAVESRRILVVDDEQPIAAAMGRLLERFGHRVETASDGERALAMIRDRPPDIVISDLRMPVMSGRELHDRLVAEGLRAHVHFVVSTGDIADPETHAFLESSGLPVLMKPFEVQDIQQLIAGLAADAPTPVEGRRLAAPALATG